MRTRTVWTVVSVAALMLAVPAWAGVDRRAAQPGTGNGTTTFTYRYSALGSAGGGGEQLYLFGPKHSRHGCRGEIVQEPVGDVDGPTTLMFTVGSKAHVKALQRTAGSRAYVIVPSIGEGKTFRYLKHWCPGYYHGTITYEDEDVQILHRFFFMVRGER
jgi:hypothetical protein